jgi:23S rRNA (uracil1939-C5)-methyltransferase
MNVTRNENFAITPNPGSKADRVRVTLGNVWEMGACSAWSENTHLSVFGGIPGEDVEVEVIRTTRQFVAARVVKIYKASPHRVAPPCAYFGPCTGCEWQHIDYTHQLALKHELVSNAFSETRELSDVKILDVIPSGQTYGYRNHARFTVGPKGKLGFINRTTRSFIPIDKCQIMDPRINSALQALQGYCGETSQVAVRLGVNTGEMLIQPPLLTHGIAIATGQTYYRESVAGMSFRIGSPSFFQVNTPQIQVMVEHVKEQLNLQGSEILIDAYAGVGTFAGLLSRYVKKVIAVEESKAAINDAKANLATFENIELYQRRVEDAFQKLAIAEAIVLLDPPRSGCHPRVLETLAHMRPDRVVYISCDPKTLARDLKHLVSGGYRVVTVQPIDLFPHTHHIECVVTLHLAGDRTEE